MKQNPISQIIDDLHLNQCAWCSNMQKCLPKQTTPDPCLFPRKKVFNNSKCALEDNIHGLTITKHYHPPDFAYPDEASIINSTEIEFNQVEPKGVAEKGSVIVKMRGFLSIPIGKNQTKPDQLQICSNYASYVFKASRYGGF